eukprot:CAMPEP_0114558096 /NCGR_PEP_ID=MMETSP0114-20121206/10189_1 /TAXON_ID=31324 /ORGANISM="Goniomonas sp, Strain m" /LENGTH=301 /DNA_ID=CAMNT_0001743443 /DNA_START=90 /DNA_END=995 /DNA_ORIENTATION=+
MGGKVCPKPRAQLRRDRSQTDEDYRTQLIKQEHTLMLHDSGHVDSAHVIMLDDDDPRRRRSKSSSSRRRREKGASSGGESSDAQSPTRRSHRAAAAESKSLPNSRPVSIEVVEEKPDADSPKQAAPTNPSDEGSIPSAERAPEEGGAAAAPAEKAAPAPAAAEATAAAAAETPTPAGAVEAAPKPKPVRRPRRSKKEPFAIVLNVAPRSPASEAGFRQGDLITELGPVTLKKGGFQAIGPLISASAGRTLDVDVFTEDADGEIVDRRQLELKPHEWSGPGLLGAQLGSLTADGKAVRGGGK